MRTSFRHASRIRDKELKGRIPFAATINLFESMEGRSNP